MDSFLVKDGERYQGAYVVLDDPESGNVVATDQDPAEALRQAWLMGYADPVLVYVPRPEDGAFAY